MVSMREDEMMTIGDDVVAWIEQEELVDLALKLSNIDSGGPVEGAVASYVYTWLEEEGFEAKKVGLLPDRFNVLGRLRGVGDGLTLLLNSHLDTAIRRGDTWSHRDPDAPIYHSAWQEGGDLVGEGIVNDKGPMAAFLIAAKAVKTAGIQLKGDLLLTAVIAETSGEPADDELPGYLGETKDLGARYLATHGGIADYALIAEGTGFSVVSVEAGMAWYRISWVSDQPPFYTPYLPDRTIPGESPNMVVRAARGVAILEEWAADYQRRWTVGYGSTKVIPKAQVGAIRGGVSHAVDSTPQICTIYLGAFTPPAADPLSIRSEILRELSAGGVSPSEVELYAWRPGYVAKGAERLHEAIVHAHQATFDGQVPPPNDPATASMWRDINVWNELGIPALTYGPRSNRHSYRRALSIESLYDSACVYARVIVDICSTAKSTERAAIQAEGQV